ncbi:hypothetical protein KJ937_01910 [Patescibacteria group bacterium]|nr:hypothetical protein [Patescibacteria group bacterium]
MNDSWMKRTYLIEDLLEKGYPVSSLSIDWPHAGTVLGLAIVNPKINKPIAIFEPIKISYTGTITSEPVEKIHKIMRGVSRNYDIPLIVYLDGKNKDMSYFYYVHNQETDNFELPQIKKLPTYKELVEFSANDSKESTIYDLRRQSYWCALILMLLIIINIFFKILSKEVISIIILIIGLLFIPYASKIKMLGLEIEPKENAPQNSSKEPNL